MSKFTKWIEEYLFDINPNFIYPLERRNELFNNFIKDGLEDLSITRINSDWGIQVLTDKYKDKKHVAYVWIDALFSYLSALNYLQENDINYQEFWNNKNTEIIHLMSKEITRFHAIYWPIFLNCLNLNLPTKIISHGWIVTPEGKMSKSLGNVIDPNEYINEFGAESLRFFFIKGLILENDSIFSRQRFIEIHNTYLANTFGNVVSRVFAMINKWFNGVIPSISKPIKYSEYYIKLDKTIQKIKDLIDANKLSEIIDELYSLNSDVNDLIENEKPRTMIDLTELNELLNLFVNIIKVTWYFLAPITSKTSKQVLNAFGIDLDKLTIKNINDITWINGSKLNEFLIPFQRIK